MMKIAMRGGIVALLFAPLLTLPGAAQSPADAIAACRSARDGQERLAACSRVIADAAATDAHKAMAYRNRGRARAEAGANADAIVDLTEAIKRDQADVQAYLTRARVRLAANDTQGAIADYDAAVALRPAWAIGYIGRGHARLVAGAPDLAIADFTKAIEADPRNAHAYNNRGLAHRKAGNLDRAIAEYTAAIDVNPIYGLAYANRGYANEERGAKDKAVEDYRNALRVDPSLTGAREGLERLKAVGALAGESAKLIAQGKALVETHCQGCHAVGVAGASPNPKAPPFRAMHDRHPMLALRAPLTRGIAAPHDEMPKFRLPDADVDKIIAYINDLGAKP